MRELTAREMDLVRKGAVFNYKSPRCSPVDMMKVIKKVYPNSVVFDINNIQSSFKFDSKMKTPDEYMDADTVRNCATFVEKSPTNGDNVPMVNLNLLSNKSITNLYNIKVPYPDVVFFYNDIFIHIIEGSGMVINSIDFENKSEHYSHFNIISDKKITEGTFVTPIISPLIMSKYPFCIFDKISEYMDIYKTISDSIYAAYLNDILYYEIFGSDCVTYTYNLVIHVLNLLCCKNIVTENNKETIWIKKDIKKKKGKKISGASVVKKDLEYKILAIGGFDGKRITTNTTKTNGGSLGVTRLHMCRGHVSTYTPERPLFGKYSGTFWIPAHARGIDKLGIIKKDYTFEKLS